MSSKTLEKRFLKASSEFWKRSDNDLSDAIIELADAPDWAPFLPEKSDGLTDYRTLYKDKKIGIFLFRSRSGALIEPHYHRFDERVVFVQGNGTLIMNRKEAIELDVQKSVFIPKGTLHQGEIPVVMDDEFALSVCCFYYFDQRY